MTKIFFLFVYRYFERKYFEDLIMIYRKLALLFLSIWWGAFTFYAGIVIPTGMKILGSHTEMGFITQEVTNYINAFSLPIFVFVTFIFRQSKQFFRLGLLLILLQISLFILHKKLFYLLDYQAFIIKSKADFYNLHRIYLLISTLIWLIVSGLIFVEFRE